jgi:hypothetical protein
MKAFSSPPGNNRLPGWRNCFYFPRMYFPFVNYKYIFPFMTTTIFFKTVFFHLPSFFEKVGSWKNLTGMPLCCPTKKKRAEEGIRKIDVPAG